MRRSALKVLTMSWNEIDLRVWQHQVSRRGTRMAIGGGKARAATYVDNSLPLVVCACVISSQSIHGYRCRAVKRNIPRRRRNRTTLTNHHRWRGERKKEGDNDEIAVVYEYIDVQREKRREGGVPIDNLDYYFSFPFSSLSVSSSSSMYNISSCCLALLVKWKVITKPLYSATAMRTALDHGYLFTPTGQLNLAEIVRRRRSLVRGDPRVFCYF